MEAAHQVFHAMKQVEKFHKNLPGIHRWPKVHTEIRPTRRDCNLREAKEFDTRAKAVSKWSIEMCWVLSRDSRRKK